MPLPSKYNLLIIGNGFDINCGLQTSYSNFIDSNRFKKLESEGSILAHELRSAFTVANWVDIERELAEYSTRIMASRTSMYDPHRSAFRDEFFSLVQALSDYIKYDIDYKSINFDSDGPLILRSITKAELPLVLVNFNFTSTIKYIEEHYNIRIGEHIHIHGDAISENIVFGVSDSERVSFDHAFIKKSAFDGLYTELHLYEIMKFADSITIFGHSLGITDKSHFKKFFNGSLRNRTIEIFIHSTKSKESIIGRLDDLTDRSLGQFRVRNNLVYKQTQN